MLLDIISLNEYMDIKNKKPAIERMGGILRPQGADSSPGIRESSEIYTRARAIFYRARRQRRFRASAIF
jgi:hypothetical protein